jgi:peptide/nickel transport system substrate-binding protein
MVYTGISNDNMLSSITGEGSLLRPKPSNVSEPEGWLAESWTSEENFTVWTFKLRKDVRWHDGSTFTAQDFKFWLDLAVFPPSGRKAASGIPGNFGPPKEVQVVDDHTVRIVLNLPSPHFLETVKTYSNVVSHKRDLAQKEIDKGNVKVQMSDIGWVALGPFKYDQYQKGSSFRAVKFDQYFEKDAQGQALPYLDAVFFPIIPDVTVAVSAFRAGRIDGTSRGTGHHLTPDHVSNIKKSLGDKAYFLRLPYLGWGAGFNATKAPFNDVRLRRALNMYTDRAEQAQLVYGGFGIENALMHPGSYWWNPDFRNWPGYNSAKKAQDQADAKKLLKEAGLEGTPITITCRDFYLQNCEFLNLTLKQLGTNPRIDVMDQLRLQELTQPGNYQVQITSFSPELPNQLLLTLVTTNPLNTNKHGDTKVDDYHKTIQTTIDPAERRKVLWEAEYYVAVEQAYAQPWTREEGVIGLRTYVKGVWTPAAAVHNLNDHRTTWIDTSLK